jgi:hypothetical protein
MASQVKDDSSGVDVVEQAPFKVLTHSQSGQFPWKRRSSQHFQGPYSSYPSHKSPRSQQANPYPQYTDNSYGRHSKYYQPPNQRNNVVRQIHPRRPRSQPLQRVVTEFMTTVKQEFIVVNDRERFQKCIDYFKELLHAADDDHKKLPRTIIFCSSFDRAMRLAYALCFHGIPTRAPPREATTEDLIAEFDRCFVKEVPILVFDNPYLKGVISNVELIVNYDLPKTLEEFGSRIQSFVQPEKCITYVSSNADRELLKSAKTMVEASGGTITESFKALFKYENPKFEDYLEQFVTADSWLRLLDD